MTKADLYSVKGTRLEAINLPGIFGEKVNVRTLAQAIRVYEEKAHIGLAKTKTRGEINRTKKKWYKQKGTGGARHGARSAPIFVGGGTAHGPKALRRNLSLPEKIKRKALASALSFKAQNKEVVVVEGLSKLKKTKDAASLVKKLAAKTKAPRFTFVLDTKNPVTQKALRNLRNMKILLYKDLNARDAFNGGTLVMAKEIFKKNK